ACSGHPVMTPARSDDSACGTDQSHPCRRPVRRCAGMWTVLEYVALGLALVGVVALLLGRFGRPAPMSWLDAVMGACATGALLVPAGPVIAVAGGGIVGVLALSRWQLRPQESGPQFSPVVLAAILTFAVVGLVLLLVG